MPITDPAFDDRTFEQLIAEARARIPVHNPEWTNFNDSDPGITLLQLFAFMTDSLLYRSSLIPKRNRIKFLKLLGIPMQAAAAAQGIVCFSNLKGPLETQTLPAGLNAYAGQIQFRTEDGLDVLPVEGRVYYKGAYEGDQQAVADIYDQLYASFVDGATQLSYYETRTLAQPVSGAPYPVVNLAETRDHALWIALLARNDQVVAATRGALGGKTLTLGILPASDERERVLPAGSTESPETLSNLLFQVPNKETSMANLQNGYAQYITLDARPSGDLLSEPGIVQLTLPPAPQLELWSGLDPTETGVGNLPPALDDPAVQNRLITWIRISLPGLATGIDEETSQPSPARQLNGYFSWIGINCARITQRMHVTSERVATGNGEPDQVYALVNTPVIKDSVELTVNGEHWSEIDDLMTASSEVPVQTLRAAPNQRQVRVDTSRVNVFTVDRESGEIRFGDGMHGARPPRGASIRASYDFGGGRQGNIGIGAITQATNLPSGVTITNPLETWGGDEPESVEQAEKLIPRYVQHRDHMVTKQDYQDFAMRTPGVDIGRAEAVPLYHPAAPLVLSPGLVTVMVIPTRGSSGTDTPEPDRLFLETICQYLDPRRIVTTELHVRGPDYKNIWVSIGMDVVPGWSIAVVREAIKQRIRTFLSPLIGGFDGTGWPLEKPVEALELWAVATRVEGVSKVNQVLLTAADIPDDRIPMLGLELPRLVAVEAQTGIPLPLDLLQGSTPPPVTTDTRMMPVPVIPTNC